MLRYPCFSLADVSDIRTDDLVILRYLVNNLFFWLIFINMLTRI